MSFLDRVEVLILTYNEEANLARTLDALRAFPRVVILDSGSTDATLRIAAAHSNVRVCTRPFDSHAAQWNHGLNGCGIAADWVLALDADYVLTPQLVDEIARLDPAPGVGGFRARFRYCVEGRALSGSLYPPVTLLYPHAQANYVQDGHTQRVVVQGEVGALQGLVLHDDRKPLSAWLAAQDRYAQLECALLQSTSWSRLRWRDRLRRMVVVTPWLVPLYCLTVGRGLLDGRRGLFYALQRGIAEAILSAKLLSSAFMGRSRT
ncbi:MAG: glycosyltransferase family 2 protein [Pseudomonadota bacterium]